MRLILGGRVTYNNINNNDEYFPPAGNDDVKHIRNATSLVQEPLKFPGRGENGRGDIAGSRELSVQ